MSAVDDGWDVFWRWEILRRRSDPIDFRRWKADSSRALRGLPAGRDRDGRPPRLLDASCGMGFHTLIQHELGFDVDGCDVNPRVLAAARALFEAEGADIETFEARWEDLGALRPDAYDLVFNDEVHQVRGRDAMLAVLRGFAGCLRPGGSLVFFFADALKPDDGLNQAAWEWEHRDRDRVAWTLQDGERTVQLRVVAEREGDDCIAEHHRYTIKQPGRPDRAESTTLRKSYCWDWDRWLPVMREAGFATFESHRFDAVQGHWFAMNLATKAS